MSKIRIVFMGTPEFAANTLETLNNSSEIEIAAVITAPDKQAGRGRKIRISDVKECALNNKLSLLQPTNLKDSDFIEELQKLNADLFVVVAFRMLPEVVWTMPPLGTINLHASLLPKYRGAAPINWAIINGENETGVTTFFIEKEIDTGEIIEQERIPVGPNETVGELYTRLMRLGATTTLSTVIAIKDGKIKSRPQLNQDSATKLPLAPKIFKNNCRIKFNRSSIEVHDFCRGLSPYPGAWCRIVDNETGRTRLIKILKTKPTSSSIKHHHLINTAENKILIPCKNDYIEIMELQLEGKRRMTTKEFLAGNNLSNHSVSQE